MAPDLLSESNDPVIVDLTSVSPSVGGGVGQVAKGVVRGLVSQGVSTRCFISPGTGAAWLNEFNDFAADLTFEPVNVALRSDSKWQKSIRRVVPSRLLPAGLLRTIRAVRSRAVAHHSSDSTVWYPFHRSVASSDSAVITVHDLRVFEPGLESVMDQQILTANIRRAKALICSWPHPYEHMLRLFPEASAKAFLISLPVLNPGRPTERTLPSDGPVRLLYPSFVTPHKNHEVIIRALAARKNLVLTCTGLEVEDYANKMRSLAADLGVADRIHWRGHVSAEELEREYAAAHILMMPSKWEAASGPIYEAVARELPFVSSSIAPLKAQISALGLTAPTFSWDRPDEAVNAIDEVIGAYESYRAELVKPARTLTGRQWEDTARDYADVFKWVSGNGEKPTHLQGRDA